MPERSRWMVVLLALALSTTACSGTTSGPDLEATCGEYLGLPNDDRGIIVRTLGVELGWTDASNPLVGLPSVDASCGEQNPDVTVRALVEFFVNNSNPGSENMSGDGTDGSSAGGSATTTLGALEAATATAHTFWVNHEDSVSDRCTGDWTYFELVGDLVVVTCADAAYAYDLVKQTVAWTTELPGETLFHHAVAGDAVVVQYGYVVPANGLDPAEAVTTNEVLDVATGQRVLDFEVNREAGDELERRREFGLSEDGTIVLMANVSDDTVKAFDTQMGDALWETMIMRGSNPLNVVDSVVVVGEQQVLDVSTGADLWQGDNLEGDAGPVLHVDGFNSDRVLDSMTGAELWQFDGAFVTGRPGLVIISEGDLAGVTYDGEELWRLPSGVVRKVEAYQTGRIVVETLGDEFIEVDPNSGTELARLLAMPLLMNDRWILYEGKGYGFDLRLNLVIDAVPVTSG